MTPHDKTRRAALSGEQFRGRVRPFCELAAVSRGLSATPIMDLSLNPFDVLMAVGFGNVASKGRGGGALSSTVNLDTLAASEE